MKRYLLIIPFFLSVSGWSQSGPKFDLEASSFRAGAEAGPRLSALSFPSAQLFPGLSAGITLGSHNRIPLSFRRLPAHLSHSGENYSEELSNKGFQVSAGYERIIPQTKWLCFLPEVGVFYDYARQTGTASPDYALDLEVNHRRHFFGAYVALKFGIKLSDRIQIIAGHRLNIGNIKSKMIQQKDLEKYPYEDYSGFAWTPDAALAVAFRVRLN